MTGYRMLDENAEVSDELHARLTAIANKLAQLDTEDERNQWARQDRYERFGDTGEDEYDECENDESCKIDGPRNEMCDNCREYVAEFDHNVLMRDVANAERELDREILLAKLNQAGARRARPYEHHNEDEAYFKWAERER